MYKVFAQFSILELHGNVSSFSDDFLDVHKLVVNIKENTRSLEAFVPGKQKVGTYLLDDGFLMEWSIVD